MCTKICLQDAEFVCQCVPRELHITPFLVARRRSKYSLQHLVRVNFTRCTVYCMYIFCLNLPFCFAGVPSTRCSTWCASTWRVRTAPTAACTSWRTRTVSSALLCVTNGVTLLLYKRMQWWLLWLVQSRRPGAATTTQHAIAAVVQPKCCQRPKQNPLIFPCAFTVMNRLFSVDFCR
jgi:hypothetical protein